MAAGDLTTIDKVRDQLGKDTTASDPVLERLITASSKWILTRLGRPILSASYTETKDGNGGTRVRLDQCPPTPDSPPIAVTSVTVDGAAIPQRPAVSASNTNPEGWILREYGIDLVGYAFTRGSRNVVIVYTVGYAEVPEDIAQATTEHVALKYRRRGTMGVAMEAGGGEAMTYSDTSVIAGINDLLDGYRALGVG